MSSKGLGLWYLCRQVWTAPTKYTRWTPLLLGLSELGSLLIKPEELPRELNRLMWDLRQAPRPIPTRGCRPPSGNPSPSHPVRTFVLARARSSVGLWVVMAEGLGVLLRVPGSLPGEFPWIFLDPINTCAYNFLKQKFRFGVMLDLRKSYKDNTQNSYMFLIQFP